MSNKNNKLSITEGPVCKGGLNKKSKTPRPKRPSGTGMSNIKVIIKNNEIKIVNTTEEVSICVNR